MPMNTKYYAGHDYVIAVQLIQTAIDSDNPEWCEVYYPYTDSNLIISDDRLFNTVLDAYLDVLHRQSGIMDRISIDLNQLNTQGDDLYYGEL